MRSFSSYLAGALFLGCVALAALLWRQERRNARAAAGRASATRLVAAENAELRRMIAVARAERADAEKRKAAVPSPLATLLEPVDPKARPKRVPLAEVIRDHSEYADINAKELRRRTANLYGAFLDRLDLDPEKRARLLHLLEERAATEQDFKSSSAAAGLKYLSGDGAAAMAQATQDIDQDIGALVGADAKTFVRGLNHLTGTRAVINTSYSPDFWGAGVPLTDDQAAELTEAYEAAVRPQGGPTAPASGKKGLDPGRAAATLQTRLLAQSQAFLSPEQQQVLEQHLQDETTQATIIGSYMNGAEGYTLLYP